MEGVRGGLPPGSLSLIPTFVLWAAIAGALVLIGGSAAWLVAPAPLRRLLGRLWPADLVALWLAYAAAYHLAFLDAFRLVLGRPWAVWMLCGALGGYVLLRRLPTPLRRPDVLFVLAVTLWAGVLAAGWRYVAEVERDAALLAEQPRAVLDAAAPRLEPLRRALLLTRLEPEARAATVQVLRQLEGSAPADEDALTVYRLGHLPRVREHYRLDLAKLRTYQWVQAGLLAVALLLWAFGHPPPRDEAGGG
jgi:hypothetical protein